MNFTGARMLGIIGFIMLSTMLLGSAFYEREIYVSGVQGQSSSGLGEVMRQVASPSEEILAQAYLLQGNFPLVLSILEGKISGPVSQAVLTRAELVQGKTNKAWTRINRQIDNPLVAEQTGLYLANQGYYQSALEWLTEYTAKHPELRTDLALQLCNVLIRLGKTKEGGELLQSLDQTRWEVVLINGDLALFRGDYPGAWQYYTRVKSAGYLQKDPGFLAKTTLAAMGADQDWGSIILEIRQQAPQSGLADYLEAQGALRKGDFVTAQAKLQAALAHTLPEKLGAEITSLQQELTARINAEGAIQAVIARGGH